MPDTQTVTVNAYHPYPAFYWEFKLAGGVAADIVGYDAYINADNSDPAHGQGFKTVGINATVADVGSIRCTVGPESAGVPTPDAEGTVTTDWIPISVGALTWDVNPGPKNVTIQADKAIFVDSVAGIDTNDGLSAAAAVQTIAKGLELVNADLTIPNLLLKRGSVWVYRRSGTLDDPDREVPLKFERGDLYVGGYGTGERPLLDALEEPSVTPSAYSELDNVYYIENWNQPGITHRAPAFWDGTSYTPITEGAKLTSGDGSDNRANNLESLTNIKDNCVLYLIGGIEALKSTFVAFRSDALDMTSAQNKYRWCTSYGEQTLIDTNGQTNITVDGVDVYGSGPDWNTYCIKTTGSDITIKNCSIQFATNGIGNAAGALAGCTIENCTLNDILCNGVYLSQYSSNVVVSGNSLSHVAYIDPTAPDESQERPGDKAAIAASSLDVSSPSNIVIENNVIQHHSSAAWLNDASGGNLKDSAISIYGVNGATTRYNDLSNCSHGAYYAARSTVDGFFHYNNIHNFSSLNARLVFIASEGCTATNNSVVGNTLRYTTELDPSYQYNYAAVNLNGQSRGEGVVSNNLIAHNTITTTVSDYPAGVLAIRDETYIPATVDTNLYWDNTVTDKNSAASPPYYVTTGGGTPFLQGYDTVADMTVATGVDANSVEADPLLNGLLLTAGSPAIDLGQPDPTGGLHPPPAEDINGNPIVGNPDAGANEYTP